MHVRHIAFVALLCGLPCTTGAQAAPVVTPSHAESPAVPLSIGESFTIDSDVLHERRRINVYAPPGYAASDTARLPVLYMPDGGLGEDFLHVAGLVQVLVGNGGMRPFLLVGIENTERRRDMTGPTDDPRDRRIAPHVGGSADFRRFIRTELKPQVRSRYRTTNESAIVGESLAGLFVIETLLLEPDLFDTYIAFDASLWWNGERLTKDAGALLEKQRGDAKRLFFASSNTEGAPALAERFEGVLARGGNPLLVWRYESFPRETHATIYHPAALRAFREMFNPVGQRPEAPAGPAAGSIVHVH